VALGVVVARVADALPAGATEADRYVTVMFAIGVATLLAGAGFFLLGYFRLGGVIRYIPYSVIGGFLAGTGWLIALGGLAIVLGEPATLHMFTIVPDPTAIQRLGLTAAFVALLIFARGRFANPLAVPAVILAAVGLFIVIGFGSGNTAADLHAGGWLINLPASGRMWPAVNLPQPADIDWRAIAVGMIDTPLLIVVTAIAFLLNATGIEMESGDDVDLDHELKSIGFMNLAGGAGGGLPGFHSVSVTLLAIRLEAQSRWVAMIVAAVALAALVLGSVILDIIPTLVLGGMLLWIGGQLMAEWLVAAYRRLDLGDYLIILLIFLIIVFVGFATGIVVGLIAAILLFVLRYGRVDIVRHEISGSDYQSSVEGPKERSALLHQHGQAILIVKLQGFLFFGTSDGLRRRAQAQMMAAANENGGFLVIDFHRVTGIDSSTVLSFARLSQLAARHDFTVVLTALPEEVRDALTRGDLQIGEGSPIRIEADTERGLKWCEDALIARVTHGASPGVTLAEILTGVTGNAEAAEAVATYCERVGAAAGIRLIEQDSPSEDVFFIESGEAVIEIAGDGNTPTYLTTVVAGAVVGEIAFYLGDRRSASVTATTEMVAWRFSRQAMERLQQESPAVALSFHRGMAAMLSKRLTRTDRLVRFLAD
jgi:SulP family sulfate permease